MYKNAQIKCANSKLVDIDSLVPNPKNPNKHPEKQIKLLAKIIKHQGQRLPIVVSKRSGFIVSGHGRLAAIKSLGWQQCAIDEQEFATEADEYAHMIADNKIAELAQHDMGMMIKDLKELDVSLDFELLGFDKLKLDDFDRKDGALRDKFIYPPVSVLNTREGGWQDRKKQWIDMGIKSELGRDANLMGSDFVERISGGTSVFDPALAEIMYLWFCGKGGVILDPFAGGSVRGVVAAKLGFKYYGVDLRGEQVEENKKQWRDIGGGNDPQWVVGDSRDIDDLLVGVEADFVFSCPPYMDLETYSDDQRDLSNMSDSDFLIAYDQIIKKTVGKLRPNRFACFVVGEVRGSGPNGSYKNFISKTINCFLNAGCEYYNEIVLVNMMGTLPTRAGKYFSGSRKIGKVHQTVLVFVKGEAKEATAFCGEVEVGAVDKWLV